MNASMNAVQYLAYYNIFFSKSYLYKNHIKPWDMLFCPDNEI